MHRSRLRRVNRLQDSIDEAVRFWGEALGRSVDKDPTRAATISTLMTSDEPIVEIQRVDHESRVHQDIETDDIPAEVVRLEKLRANVVNRLTVAGDGADRPTLLRRTGATPRLPEERQFLELRMISAFCGTASRAPAWTGFGL